jgi:hypothetical protein
VWRPDDHDHLHGDHSHDSSIVSHVITADVPLLKEAVRIAWGVLVVFSVLMAVDTRR